MGAMGIIGGQATREERAVLDAEGGKRGRLDAYERQPRDDGGAEPIGHGMARRGGRARDNSRAPTGASGDGQALCFRAGARLADCEFVQFHPTTLYIAGASRFLISEVVRGAGAVLRDRNGDRVMEGVHPMADLAPRDEVARDIYAAIVRQTAADPDNAPHHVFLDASPIANAATRGVSGRRARL